MATTVSAFSSRIALKGVASQSQGRSNTTHRAQPARSVVARASARSVTKNTGARDEEETSPDVLRRGFLTQTALSVTLAGLLGVEAGPALAVGAGIPLPVESPLCDAACMKALDSALMVTTKSGLQYKDIVVGKGPAPFPGVQVVADFVALVKDGKGQLFVFQDTTATKPQDIRVTGDPETANVIPGLDEGIISMRVGGIRRLYVPGPLAFPKGLASGPGRPRVPPNSDVIFDVFLRYIPGSDDEDDEDYVLDINAI